MSQGKAFRDQDARAAWNEGARAWEEFVTAITCWQGGNALREQTRGAVRQLGTATEQNQIGSGQDLRRRPC